MQIDVALEIETPWMLHCWSGSENGMVFRKINEECDGFDEAIISQTEYGWVCINKTERFVDVVDNMKDAYFWLSAF